MKRSFTFLMSLFLTIGTMWAQTFPETSTAEAPKYYTIASYNRGGYLTSVGEGKSVEHVATTKGSLWYFTQADENGGLYFCNMAGGFLAADKTVSETAGVWYVLPNGINTEGVSISSTNPISDGSCVDANNSNTGVGAWYPQAGDWEGTTWVFAEVTDFSAIFNVDEAKTAAKAEIDALASVSVIYPDATEAKSKIDAVLAEGTSVTQLAAAIDAINQCVVDYKNAAYQALDGKYYAITTPARGNGYMMLDGNRVVGLAAASSPAAVWQFEYAEGTVKVFNPYTGKYLCEPAGYSENVAVTEEAASAGAYQLVINAAAENEEAKVKLTSNGKSVHMAGGSVLVRWDNGGASEWTVAEVTDFAEIVSLHKAAALATVEAYAQLPAIFDVVATQEAINGVTATDWSAFAAIDEAANTVVPTGKFAFQSTSNDNHRDSVWVSANMETLKAIGAAEQDKNAHWTLKPASGGAFYIYNVANELYLGAPSGNCTLTAEPVAAYTVEVIDAENNVVEFKCGSETLHASNHEDDKLLSYDADEAASRWTIVAVDELYDLSEGTWSDATSYIVNANLASKDGWTVSGLENDGKFNVSYKAAEFYSGWGALERPNGHLKQEVTLPAGTYRLTGKAFFRQGNGPRDNPGKSLGYLVAGDNKALVKTLGSANGTVGAFDTGANALYADGTFDNVLEFTLAEETTLNIGYEVTFDEMKSWFIVGALTLEKKITLKDNFKAQVEEFSAFGQSSMAMYSLGAVQEKWSEVMAVVDPLYFAVSEGGQTLKAEVVAAMELMTTSMAAMKPVLEYYDGTFSDTKWAMYDVQDNSTANSEEVRVAFDDALTAALNVSAVTTLAELEAKVAEMEAARQAYVVNAVPTNGTAFDMNFLIADAAVTSKDAWTNGNTASGEAYDGAPDANYLDWCNWSGTVATFNMYQEITNMPAGVYTLKAATRSHADMVGTIYADTIKAEFHHVGNSGNELGRGWGWTTVENIIVFNGKMTIGFTGIAQNNGVWAGADNFSLAYTGALPDSVLLGLKKEAFVERANKFAELTNTLDYSWQAVNNNYYYPVLDSVIGNPDYEMVGVVDTLDKVTDAALLDEFTAKMDNAEAMIAKAYAAAAEYTYYKNLCWDASDNSTAVTEDAKFALEEVLMSSNMAGYSLATVEAIEAAAAELKEAYIAYISHAVANEGYMFDVTCLVKNAAVTSAEGWTNAEGRIINNTDYTDAPDKAAFDAGWWAGVIDIHQVLPELPAGEYVLSAVARSASPDSYLYAKTEESEVKATLPQNGDQGGTLGNGWDNVSADTLNVLAGDTLTIGVYINNPGTNFAAADNFKLYYGGTNAVVEEVTLNTTWGELYEIGATLQLEATVAPSNAVDQAITWTSSADYVTVDETGLVTVVAAGQGQVEIKAATANGVSASCWLMVEAFNPGDVQWIQLNKTWGELTSLGATLQLEVKTIEPADATDKTITWSSDTSAVTVDETGLVTVVAPYEGAVTITATAKSGVEATCMLSVTALEETLPYADFFVTLFEGDELVEFSSADLIIFDLVENVELSGEVHATLTTPSNAEGETLVASHYLDEEIPEEPCHIITFEGTQVYTAPGAYTLTIPEGLFTVDGAPNAATVVNFTVMEPVVVEFEATIVSVTPAEGEVTELSEIIVQFDSDIVVPYSNVFVTNEDGTEFEFELDPNHSDYTQARYFAKDGAITAAGTYTFDCSQIDHVVNRLTRERIYPFTGTYTWTIKAVDDSIDHLNADADAVIYDIHGRRVTEMTKGIYIVNGKKVIKK